MLKQLFLLTAFGFFIPNAVFSQKKNRISLQSGLVNCFFDGSPIINKPRVVDFLFDAKGFELMRRIKKSQISFEYMKFNTTYQYKLNFGQANAPAQYMWKQLDFITVFYNRELLMGTHWSFQYGSGATYTWGDVALHHYAFDLGFWSESFDSGYISRDIGLNLKAGIEYTPIKWVTIYSNFNFLGSVYQKNNIDFSKSYTASYHKNVPSRYSLFLRFGIGFNF